MKEERGRKYSPVSPDVVVHDSDVVKHLCKSGNVGHRVTVWAEPRGNACSSSQDQVLADRVLTEFLQEGEEVGRVVCRYNVAPNTLVCGGFPTGSKALTVVHVKPCERHILEVNTIHVVGRLEIRDGFHELGAVLSGGDVG